MTESTTAAVERVIDMMRDRLHEPITVRDMARTAHFSRYHFQRFFLRETGITPGRYLSCLRFEKAKRLLLTTETSITQIGYQVGYNSMGTFGYQFRLRFGMSPTEYRQRG